MTRSYTIADQQDERWNRFHRQAQDKRDSWASLRGRTLEGVWHDESASIDEDAWEFLSALIDADELARAEDLIRKYKED